MMRPFHLVQSLRIIMTKMAMAMVERQRRRDATQRLAMLPWVATVAGKTRVSILRPRGLPMVMATITAQEQ